MRLEIVYFEIISICDFSRTHTAITGQNHFHFQFISRANGNQYKNFLQEKQRKHVSRALISLFSLNSPFTTIPKNDEKTITSKSPKTLPPEHRGTAAYLEVAAKRANLSYRTSGRTVPRGTRCTHSREEVHPQRARPLHSALK